MGYFKSMLVLGLAAHAFAGSPIIKVDFDMTGHQVARLARNVPAGASGLSREIRALPEGVYMVHVRFNGRTMQNAVQLRVER